MGQAPTSTYPGLIPPQSVSRQELLQSGFSLGIHLHSPPPSGPHQLSYYLGNVNTDSATVGHVATTSFVVRLHGVYAATVVLFPLFLHLSFSQTLFLLTYCHLAHRTEETFNQYINPVFHPPSRRCSTVLNVAQPVISVLSCYYFSYYYFKFAAGLLEIVCYTHIRTQSHTPTHTFIHTHLL